MVAVLGGVALGLGGASAAGAAGTTLITETFANADVAAPASWTVPAGPDGNTNLACLTAGTATTQVPIPDCSSTAIDTAGNGVLRLTGAAQNEEGGLLTTSSVPASNGLDVTFDSYQYGGSGADGIAFVLAAEDPSDPVAPANIGQPGGDLGYAAGDVNGPAQTGLADGYLGIGLDVYGNYSNLLDSGTGCTEPTWADQRQSGQVVVRGPGNGSVGYCPINSSLNAFPSTTQTLRSTSRAASEVPVEVLFNTTGGAQSLTGSGFTGDSVPAGDYGVAWTPVGGSAEFYDGPLPSTTNDEIPSGLYPSGWINPATGIPYQIGFGWVASTGEATDNHEVSDVTATSLDPVPVLTAAISDDQSHTFTRGGSVNYTLSGGVAAGVDEADPVTMSTTLPTGLTPGTATGTGWTCTTTGQDVSCTYQSGTITAGTTLPPVTLPAAVAANASTVTNALTTDLTVSSDDGDPANASDPGTAVSTYDTYTPVTPTRICDTRAGNPSNLTGDAAQCNGTDDAGERLSPDTPLTVDVGGEFTVPSNATAAVVNVTAVGGSGPGYVTVYPAGDAVPTASNVNFPAVQAVPNLTEVGLGTDQEITLVSNVSVDVVVDLEGYDSPTATDAGLYDPLSSPARICDTRAGNPSGLSGGDAQCNGADSAGDPLVADTPYTVQVDGNGGVPSQGVSAVVLNVTVTDATAQGYLTVYAEGGSAPTASSLNFIAAGKNVANRVIVPVSAAGAISLYASESTDAVVDVSGWFTTGDESGSSFVAAAAPVRICDTRPDNFSDLSGGATQCNGTDNAGAPLGPGQSVTVQVTGLAGVPTDATSVVLTLTGVLPTAQTHLTAYPGPSQPLISDVNPAPGTRRANLDVSALSSDGTVTITNYAGTVNVVIDVSGWYIQTVAPPP